METPTLVLIFFALCGMGILLSLAAPASQQGNVLAWLGCLAAMALVLAGANALLAGKTFSEPLWPLPGLTTLTLSLDRLSAVFLLVTGLVFFPASIYAGGELKREPNSRQRMRVHGVDVRPLCVHRPDFSAGDVVLFLLAWEVMSILCWLLIVSRARTEKTATSARVIFCWRWAKPERSRRRWVFSCSRLTRDRWILALSNRPLRD